MQKRFTRPDWTKPITRRPVDLSTNVHFDSIISEEANEVLAGIDSSVLNYPDEYKLYSSISNHYNVPIRNMAIGFGATELIERSLRNLEYDHVYIVDPMFEMVEVYCNILNKPYTKIDIDNVPTDMNGICYISNPNGNNGRSVDVRGIVGKFKYVLLDEAYADFCTDNSLLYDVPSNTLVIKSLSKSLGFAGMRVGFAVGSTDLIDILQAARMNYITSTVNAILVEKLIDRTDQVIARMNETKQYLEKKYDLRHSEGNYVIFDAENVYTRTFGYKRVGSGYRMALTDLNTLHEYTTTTHRPE